MATSQPPTYFFTGIAFNDAFFNTNTTADGGITQSYADNQYLARVGTSTSSTNFATTFNNDVTVSGTLSALESSSLITTSQTTNGVTTLGTTSATQYYVPFVTSKTSAIAQQLYTDSGAGNHLAYTPSTNTFNVGGATNGNITVTGTASTLSIAGTGSNALSVPNGKIALGTTPNMTYSTLPNLSTSQIGYYTYLPATLPLTLTTQGTGGITILSAATFIPAGVYSINIQVYYTLSTIATGLISYVAAGLSTLNSSFSTPSGTGYCYLSGMMYIPPSSPTVLIFQSTKVFTVLTGANHYFLTQMNYTGITPQISLTQNYLQLVKIA